MKKIIIFLLFITGLIYGQEKKVSSVDKKNQKELLLRDKTVIESRLEEISSSPTKYVNKRKQELQNWIDKLPNRKPTQESRLTMKEYLKKLKKQVEDDPGNYITQETEKLINQKAHIEAQINEIDKIDDNTAIETDKEIKDVKEGK